MVAVRGNNQFRTTYQNLIHQGNPKMVALIAIMRKLLILMRAILITGKPYQAHGDNSINDTSKQQNNA